MTVFLLISTQLNCCSFSYHRHYSLGQNTCTAFLLIKVYFCIQEYLQQAQDLVENESILLQTLGKEKTEIHINSRAPCACKHSPYLRKCSYLPIREILVITWRYVQPTDQLTARPSTPQAYQCKITQSTGIATRGYFGKKSHSHPCLVKQRQLKSQ